MKGKEGKNRSEKTIFKKGQEWTLPAHLGQLKRDPKVERDCFNVICDAPMILQDFGID